MRTTIEIAKQAGLFTHKEVQPELERFAELVRADERNSWPAEMEAMERQVNILHDALHQEREACAKVCYELPWKDMGRIPSNLAFAAAIRARSNT